MESDLPAAIAIVVRSGQQLFLTEEARRFVNTVEFDKAGLGEANRLLPAGKASAVFIDPLVRSGRPTVAGVAKDRLWELVDAGESFDEIAQEYDLSPELVRSAVAYEEQLLAAVRVEALTMSGSRSLAPNGSS